MSRDHSYLSVKGIVERVSVEEWRIPELQRGFVWTPKQVRALADSLLKDIPIGNFLIWKIGDAGPSSDSEWILDGHQRVVAFCTLLDQRPGDWESRNVSSWDKHREKYSIIVDFAEKELAVAKNKKKKDTTRDLLFVLKQCKLPGYNAWCKREAVVLAKVKGVHGDSELIYQKLKDLKKILNQKFPVIRCSFQIDRAQETFKLINAQGTRVRSGNIAASVIATVKPKWLEKNLRPFKIKKRGDGFDFNEDIFIRTLIAKKGTKFNVFNALIKDLKDLNINNSKVQLRTNAFITAVLIHQLYPTKVSCLPTIAWMLCSTCKGLVASSGEGNLETELSIVRKAKSYKDVIAKLFKHIEIDNPRQRFKKNDFLEGHKNKQAGIRLFLYLIVDRNTAHDWLPGKAKIIANRASDYKPEFHHIFPKACKLDKENPEKKLINAPANLALISAQANKEIGNKHPSEYMKQIHRNRIVEQYAGEAGTVTSNKQLERWLEKRAGLLAKQANQVMKGLMSSNK